MDIDRIDERPGYICFKAIGKGAKEHFQYEAGGHRWQRIPPTEKRGRVQTSTITVAVLEEVSPKDVKINEKDLEWKFSRGTGPGGQPKTKTDTAVQLTHIPSKITVKCDGRSQSTNKETALYMLRSKLKAIKLDNHSKKVNSIRSNQIGSGMRGDKIRTIRVRDDKVIDHQLNRTMKYSKYARGDFSGLKYKK